MNELRKGLADYLVLRRSLGYKLARSGTVLEDFVGFAEAGGWTHIHTEVALSWALRAPNAESRWRADRLAMVRGLARYLHAIDPDHEVPPTGLIPGRRRQPAPFLYSDEQVADLMAASRRLRSPIQAVTLEAVVGLLWATGLRVAEALRLDNSDLDQREHALHVRESKGGRSRIVPADGSVMAALLHYQRVRDEAFAAPSVREPLRLDSRSTMARREPRCSLQGGGDDGRLGNTRPPAERQGSVTFATASPCRPCSPGTAMVEM